MIPAWFYLRSPACFPPLETWWPCFYLLPVKSTNPLLIIITVLCR